MNDVFLTPEQAAEMLNLSTYTIRAYARQGVIPAHKIGRTWRFSRTDLEEWMQANRQQHSLYGGLVAREADENIPGPADAHEAAVDTLRAIRERARKGSVLSVVQESRRELLQRGRSGHSTE